MFDTGDFDSSATFLLTDWLAHTPKEVIAKNFQTSIAAWNGLPSKELFIFPGRESVPSCLFEDLRDELCRDSDPCG